MVSNNNLYRIKQNRNNTLNVTDYTYDSYFLCFPDASDDDFLDFIGRDLSEYLPELGAQDGMKLKYIRHVVIDDEYFNWLKDKSLENTTENRVKYINNVSNEDAERLWEKSYGRFDVSSLFIPITVVSTNHYIEENLTLNKRTMDDLANELGKLFKKINIKAEDIIIHNEMISPSLYANEFEERFEEHCHNHFDNKGNKYKNLPSRAKNTPKNPANTTLRYIPICIKEASNPIENVNIMDIEIETIFNQLPPSIENLLRKTNTDLITNPKGIYNFHPIPFIHHSFDAIEIFETFSESISTALNKD